MVEIRLPRTWRSRMLRERPAFNIDRRYNQADTVSDPLPLTYQSGLPAEHLAHLPQVVGRYPLGAQMVRAAEALASGALDQIDFDPAELELTLSVRPASPGDGETAPTVGFLNRAKHTNFRVFAPDGVDTVLLPAHPWRTYVLFVNPGAVDARLAFDKAASDSDGVPLGASGGFYELTLGTVSEVRAVGVGGTAEIIVNEGFAYPFPRA